MSGTAGEHVAGSGPRGGAGQGAAGERRGHREGSAVLTELGAGSQAAQVLEGGGGRTGLLFYSGAPKLWHWGQGFQNYGVGICLALPVPLSPDINPRSGTDPSSAALRQH